MTMLTPAQALEKMLAHFHLSPRTILMPLTASLGARLATDIFADFAAPPWPVSAMDGYAVHAADGVKPRNIVGESAAGRPFTGQLALGEAVLISTGAVVPAGANAVVILEDCQRNGAQIFCPPPLAGANIRAAGGDFQKGQLLLAKGARLGAGKIGLLAAAGNAFVPIFKPPKIAIITTGDELCTIDKARQDHMIYDAAGPMIAAFVESWGGKPVVYGPIGDDVKDLSDCLSLAQKSADIAIIIGGASVGPHDHGRTILAPLAPNFIVEKIAIKPGKPTFFAHTNRGYILGLPGNPASALVCARLFLVPIIRRMLGDSGADKADNLALANALPACRNRAEAMRVKINEDGTLSVFSNQDSSLTNILAKSDGIILRQAHEKAANIGDEVAFLNFDAIGQ